MVMPKYVVVGVGSMGEAPPRVSAVVCSTKKETEIATARFLLSGDADEVIVASIVKMVKADRSGAVSKELRCAK